MTMTLAGDVVRSADRAVVAYLMREVHRAALRAVGVCTHATAVMADESGAVFRAEQVGLKPEQVACTEHLGGCSMVFADVHEWIAARRAL